MGFLLPVCRSAEHAERPNRRRDFRNDLNLPFLWNPEYRTACGSGKHPRGSGKNLSREIRSAHVRKLLPKPTPKLVQLRSFSGRCHDACNQLGGRRTESEPETGAPKRGNSCSLVLVPKTPRKSTGRRIRMGVSQRFRRELISRLQRTGERPAALDHTVLPDQDQLAGNNDRPQDLSPPILRASVRASDSLRAQTPSEAA